MAILKGFPASNRIGCTIPDPIEEPMERVSIIDPIEPEPVIITCPHLEQYTALMTEEIAKHLECFAVINRGWERDDHVDFMNDRANCNSIEHLSQTPVKEEFLDPIFDFCHKIRNSEFINIYIFHIHGFVDLRADPKAVNHHNAQGKAGTDIVLGYGSGAKRLSCTRWRANAFAYFLQQEGFNVAGGKSKYAGAGRDNLNQLFKIGNPDWGVDNGIHSFQLEIDNSWRQNSMDAKFAAEAISKAIESLVELGDEGFEKDIKLPEY